MKCFVPGCGKGADYLVSPLVPGGNVIAAMCESHQQTHEMMHFKAASNYRINALRAKGRRKVESK